MSYCRNILYYYLKYYYFESFVVTVKSIIFFDKYLKKWVENVQFFNKNAFSFKFAGNCNLMEQKQYLFTKAVLKHRPM